MGASYSWCLINLEKEMKKIILLVAVIVLSSCSPAIRFTSDNAMANNSGNSSSKQTSDSKNSNLKIGYMFKGKASFYADKYDGRKTASGEVFNQKDLTAAHKTLAFGTKCKVTNLKNNKSVIVRINDRGPFVKNRVIDLSYAAAKEIDMIGDGVVEVEVVILEK